MELAVWMPAGLAMLLGMIAVAISGMISFGYLMLRQPAGSDVGELPTFAVAREVAELPGQVELWRGVPRFPTQGELDSATRRAAGLFAPTSIPLGAEDAQWLRAYCAQESHFRRMEPNVYKLCGHFHADWSVVLSRGDQTAEFAFCFGCEEAMIYVEGREPLFVDLFGSRLLHLFFEQYPAK
jgi:hypothetical protein